MPKNKKKFIDKKHATTFHVVHRSQKDPLIVDEKAPQHVFLPEIKKRKSKKEIEEERQYGIFFDDDYNYLQHLKNADEAEIEWEKVETGKSEKRVQLPSSVFASQVEEPVGLLTKTAPSPGLRLDLDPDIIAAMDEDFDFEDPDNILDDNFVELANASDGDLDAISEEDEEEMGSESGDSFIFSAEETKSRFTNYSMSSSVMRRNDQLTLLDDKFEKMFSAYEESEIGALDLEEIQGHLPTDSDIFLSLTEDLKQKVHLLDKCDVEKDKILAMILEESESEDDVEDLVIKEKEKWDCESILSTYSNIYNHPAKIEEPKASKIKLNRSGIPMNVLGEHKLTARALEKLNGQNGLPSGPKSVISNITQLSQRSKDETIEEKKKRKQALREYRKERRIERKANTAAFKDEKKRQEKILINVKTNLQGIKIN